MTGWDRGPGEEEVKERGSEKPLWFLMQVEGPEKKQAAWVLVCLGQLSLSSDLGDILEPSKILSSSLGKLRRLRDSIQGELVPGPVELPKSRDAQDHSWPSSLKDAGPTDIEGQLYSH